ncbi:MAG: trigger factor [Bacillota bacterium]
MIKARVEQGAEKENVCIVHIDVDPEMVKRYTDQAFRELRKDVTVPGFRKGRVPRVLFERRFGREVIWEEALEKILPDAYLEAIEDLDLDPIAPPEIDVKEGDPEEGGLSFTAEVEVRPEVKLGEYRGLEADLEIQEVTDEDVDETLHRVRDSKASVKVLQDEDATLAPGMMAVVDYQGYDGEEPIEQLHGEEILIELGSGRSIPGFDEGILGGRAGEKKQFSVELPVDYSVKELAGSEVRFEVDIKELKVKELPELNDELARDVFGEDSLEELRENYREYMVNDNEKNALAELEQEVVDRVVSEAEVEVPAVMVERAVEEQVSELRTRLESMDGSLEDLLSERGYESEDELREEMRGPAEQAIRQMMVLEAVADLEEIDVQQEELEEELENRARSMGVDPGFFVRHAAASSFVRDVEGELRLRKTREFLASQSCPEYAEVRDRVRARHERWQREFEERMAGQQQDDDSVKDESPGEH